jgi:hypothetical protein
LVSRKETRCSNARKWKTNWKFGTTSQNKQDGFGFRLDNTAQADKAMELRYFYFTDTFVEKFKVKGSAKTSVSALKYQLTAKLRTIQASG